MPLRLKTLPLVLLVFFIIEASSANTMPSEPLAPQGLIGTWEGVDQSQAFAVYQMIVRGDKDADFLYLIDFKDGKPPMSQFFGHATSIDLNGFKIRIRFTMDPEHVPYCDWAEIQGDAEGGSYYGNISGTITRHRSDPEGEWREPIVLQRGRWIQGLESVSDEANRIVRAPHFENGHVVSQPGTKLPEQNGRLGPTNPQWSLLLVGIALGAGGALAVSMKRNRRHSD